MSLITRRIADSTSAGCSIPLYSPATITVSVVTNVSQAHRNAEFSSRITKSNIASLIASATLSG